MKNVDDFFFLAIPKERYAEIREILSKAGMALIDRRNTIDITVLAEPKMPMRKGKVLPINKRQASVINRGDIE